MAEENYDPASESRRKSLCTLSPETPNDSVLEKTPMDANPGQWELKPIYAIFFLSSCIIASLTFSLG